MYAAGAAARPVSAGPGAAVERAVSFIYPEKPPHHHEVRRCEIVRMG
jgi:hypothetical protein